MGGQGTKRELRKQRAPALSSKSKRGSGGSYKPAARVSSAEQPAKRQQVDEQALEEEYDLLTANDAGALLVEDSDKQPTAKITIVLDQACLESVKSKSGKFELLNCDDHLSLHARLGRDPKDSRPDICHQMMLTILDSPLNKAGLVSLFVRTANGTLIQVSPELRIPRTFKRFAGLMVQLLREMKIRAETGSKTLMKTVKNPIDLHLPTNARRFATSVKGTLVDVYELVDTFKEGQPLVFRFGAMARGKIDEGEDELLSFSTYPLSGSYAVGRLLGAFEKKWGIV